MQNVIHTVQQGDRSIARKPRGPGEEGETSEHWLKSPHRDAHLANYTRGESFFPRLWHLLRTAHPKHRSNGNTGFSDFYCSERKKNGDNITTVSPQRLSLSLSPPDPKCHPRLKMNIINWYLNLITANGRLYILLLKGYNSLWDIKKLPITGKYVLE